MTSRIRTSRTLSLADSIEMAPVASEHAATIVHWRNDPLNKSMFLSKHDFSLESQYAWIERQQRDPSDFTYVAMLDNKPVGMVAIYDIDERRRCGEYGRILVDRTRRRQGIGITISNRVLSMAFLSLGMDLIYANCFSENKPIFTLLSSLGFQPTVNWRHASSQRDVIRLEVTSSAWKQLSCE